MKNLSDFLEKCPGIVGEIARTVDKTLKYSRPSISLPAAISFCAALKCGRLISSGGTEPNLYLLSLAPPSYGKTQAQNALEDMAKLAEVPNLFGGVPTSDAGLITGLTQQPRQLILWDEFGEALEDLSNARNTPKATVLAAMMIAFSTAGRTMRGKQYADGRNTVVEAPYLNVFGVSNEFSFFNSLTERFVHNGFLARWLCFSPDEIKPARRSRKPLAISPRVLEWISDIDIWRPSKEGDLAAIMGKDKKVIDLGEVHQNMAETLDGYAESSKTEYERVFWGRSAELYTKLCLAFIDDDLEEDEVNPNSPTWYCFLLTEFLIKQQIARCKEKIVGSGEKEKSKEKFLKIIAKGEEISKADLAFRARHFNLSLAEKNELLGIQIDSGYWSQELRLAEPGSSRKTTFYKRIK